ncbi:hypothetical protein [Streptosporangium vulgare]|uniref:hypothetical protein n=1 Tax=Streptosporangium vulgare TaxID=46190 RepID=UPI0031D4504C
MIVIAIIYIIINVMVGAVATWLERGAVAAGRPRPSRSPGPDSPTAVEGGIGTPAP